MDAIRKIADVKSGIIKIKLPVGFKAKKVEVIILPIQEAINEDSNLQDLLLEAPTITDSELEEYKKVRDWMGEWNVKEF